MAIATYPVGLPYRPDTTVFGRTQHHKPLAVFEPEDGPTIRRKQSLTRIKKMPYRLRFTSSQYATWENFAEVALNQAADDFLMPVPLVASTYVTRRVYIENGDWNDQAAGTYTEGVNLEDWFVSFTLCVYNAAPA